MPNKTNQNNYQNTQTYKIDIDKVKSDFIDPIDEQRSIINILTSQSTTKLNVFDVRTISGLAKFLKKENFPQESRVHCFYRMIGFPVVSEDHSSYYNPGFDNITGDGAKVNKLSDKITIANSVGNKFRTISTKRESFAHDVLKIFAVQPPTITASAFALTSSLYTRPFNIPTKDLDPFNFDISKQNYRADIRGLIGKNNKVLLSEYVDAQGNMPGFTATTDGTKTSNMAALKPDRYHLIKPFMVDPRIDFTCSPPNRRIAVPFTLNKSNLLIGENEFVKRPLLEKIITDRWSGDQSSTVGTAGKSFIDFILTDDSVRNEEVIAQMSKGDPYKLGDKEQFEKYLLLIDAMCKQLVAAQRIIQKVQSKYYWLPLPSSIGPEGGCSVDKPILTDVLPKGENYTFITEADRAIRELSVTVNSKFNSQTAGLSGTPDEGNFVFEHFDTTFDDSTSEAMGDKIEDRLDRLKEERESALKQANQALRTVEIIMGEFSGLGLCDILAIIGGLYIMPKEDLLGFLDADAFERMKNSLKVQASNPGIEKAQNSLITQVNALYILMNDSYQFYAEKNNRNV